MTHKFSVCGTECKSDTQWLRAREVLNIAHENGVIEFKPKNPEENKGEVTYALGCSKTGDDYNWDAAVNLGLYGGNRKFFLNMHGPTTNA